MCQLYSTMRQFCSRCPSEARSAVAPVAAAPPPRPFLSPHLRLGQLPNALCLASTAVAPLPPVKRDPEEKARYARPPGWTAPGPQPAGPQGRADLAPVPEEDLSYLTGDWRIFQLKRGHRWVAPVLLHVVPNQPHPLLFTVVITYACDLMYQIVYCMLFATRHTGCCSTTAIAYHHSTSAVVQNTSISILIYLACCPAAGRWMTC